MCFIDQTIEEDEFSFLFETKCKMGVFEITLIFRKIHF